MYIVVSCILLQLRTMLIPEFNARGVSVMLKESLFKQNFDARNGRMRGTTSAPFATDSLAHIR